MIQFLQLLGLLGFFLCLIMMYFTPYGERGIKVYDPTFELPDMQFHYSVEQITQSFEKIGMAGRELYQKYLILDFVFIFCFGAVMITITNKLFTGLPRNLLFIVCIFRAIFDILENSILLNMLKNFPMGNMNIIALSSYVTSLKFIMLFIWMVAIIFRISQLIMIRFGG